MVASRNGFDIQVVLSQGFFADRACGGDVGVHVSMLRGFCIWDCEVGWKVFSNHF